MTDHNGNTVSCTTSTTNLTAGVSPDPPDTATARAASGAPVDYSGCSNSLGLSPTTVVTSGTWKFQAITTMSVTATATGATVATITLGGFCSIRVAGTVTIASNVWINGSPASTLDINSAASFPLTSSGCLGLVGTTGSLSGRYTVTGAMIT